MLINIKELKKLKNYQKKKLMKKLSKNKIK